MSHRRSARRLLARATMLGAPVTATVALVAGPASAHVEVYNATAVKGGDGVVQLTVPVEEDDADTVGLVLHLPSDVDLTSVAVQPVAGWTSKIDTTDGGRRVTTIEWHADDQKSGGLKPGQFGIFAFSAAPWPKDRDSVSIPATQTYSNGDVVQWNQVAVGDAEPEHPAPVVKLGSGDDDPAPSSGSGSSNGSSTGVQARQWALEGVAAVLAAAALGVSLRSRRRSPSPAG